MYGHHVPIFTNCTVSEYVYESGDLSCSDYLWVLRVCVVKLLFESFTAHFGRYVPRQGKKWGGGGAGTSWSVKMGVSGANIGHYGTDFVGIISGVSGTRYCYERHFDNDGLRNGKSVTSAWQLKMALLWNDFFCFVLLFVKIICSGTDI